ncbi:MAG TPA: TlpA disulfide reductase family protein [Gammaproteobacteria bacterium]|nr:TlpA disulfide reductase family protein [Gammaproteobacteria bacterium]
MRVPSWSVVLPLLAAAAAMAGIYAYHRLAQTPDESVVSASSVTPASSATSGAGFSFNAYETPRELPEVSFTDENGDPVSLSDFKGKAVLLNLWATWCVPCREEMPTLDRLEARFSGKNFQVVALSLDQEGPALVREFYDTLGLEHLRIYVDDRLRAPALLSVLGVPATLLIDRDGREVGRKLGPAEWDSPEVIAEIRRHVKGFGD